jgi:hypothetical protein
MYVRKYYLRHICFRRNRIDQILHAPFVLEKGLKVALHFVAHGSPAIFRMNRWLPTVSIQYARS